jgi:glyoxylase-like metal-dependent hydrolase (beta-lactamase superfamily II)
MKTAVVSILMTILAGFIVCFGQSNLAITLVEPGKLVQVDSNLYRWTDVSNVYVLREGDAALLFDLGNGSVLGHLKDIGVKRIEWVLFTHHHREQSQGYPLLEAWDADAKIAVPEEERLLFERPSSFRKMKPSLNDTYTVHGASYVRPSVHPIKVDRAFSRMDTFTWRGHEIRCLDTRGNSPGAMSYFLKTPKGWIAFSGDVMMNDARMHNFFDTEWDYGFASGIYAIHNAAAVIREFDPVLLLPSHGPVVTDGAKQLDEYQIKLRNLAEVLLRGYDIRYSPSYQDKVSKPTSVPFVWQISQHLYKFKGTNFFPNFTLILADNGHALAVDCGLLDEEFLNNSLDLMEERLGLKKIDAVIISHMHGDHFLEAPFLKEKYGTEVWALDRMAPQIEYPTHYDYAAMIESYGKGFDSLKIDRVLKEGETFQWEGFEFTMDWMPGQTEFAMCLHGKIDGKKVAFTGDNIFADPDDPSHSGHEAVVAHNSAVLEEGYIYGAEYLKHLNPDLIIGGHSYVMDNPSDLIERYRQWSYRMREAFRELSSLDDYRYWFDPYWVKAEPYRSRIEHGETVEVNIIVRNFRESEQTHRIEIHTPPDITASPAVLEGKLGGKTRKAFPVKLTASADAAVGVNIVAFDVTLDGKRFGEWFDALIQVKK